MGSKIVDIATEWNLKIERLKNLETGEEVDIATEWNLKS